MTRLLLFNAGFFTLALLAGCGETAPKLVPVGGTVLYKGKGLCPANIYFQPRGPEGKLAFAALQTDGTFVMKTMNHGAGVVPGVYKVTLSVGLGNPPDLAEYDDKDKTPIEVTVPAEGLTDLTLSVPVKK